MMNKNEWFELLAGAQNFDEGEFNNIVVANCSTQKGLMVYRNSLLKKMNAPDFTQPMTLDNMQQWFLEPITKQELHIIKKLIKDNYWTVKELWTKCREQSVGILTLAKCLNENVNFYNGMKIYHKGQLVNVLEKHHIRQIDFIRNDSSFDIVDFCYCLEHYTVPIALGHQQHNISRKRMQEATNFEVTKENVDYLTAEINTSAMYSYIKLAMEYNKWALEELIDTALKTDMNINVIVGVSKGAYINA